MKITEIKKLKRLYSVKFDEDIPAIANLGNSKPSDKIYVTEDTIIKFRLSKETDYDNSQVKSIIDFANYSYGKNLAIYFISFKFRTSAEVSKYLIEHEVLNKDVSRILIKLQELGLIDDEKYAESFISGKILAAQSGPFSIKQKLIQKGLSDDLIESKLSELFNEEKQLEVAIKIGEKQARVKKVRLPLKQLKLKLLQTLVSKGFNYKIAEQALENLELEADEDNEQDLLVKEAEKVYNRLSQRYEGYDLKHRLSQTLGRKGFDWGDISDILNNFEF
ncbi:MAG TPA: recombination regulator RecX [Lactovum miscens]|uniref:recombination regulator RecX n=1 Tax=Lactovum miscens TaxID=190387 RepID=UPI002EDAC8B9